MKQGEFKNRRVDKASVLKTKQALWKHMVANKPKPKRFRNPFSSLFLTSRLATVGAFLFLIVAASVFTLPYHSRALTSVDFNLVPVTNLMEKDSEKIILNLVSSSRVATAKLVENIILEPNYEFEVIRLDNKTHTIIIDLPIHPDNEFLLGVKTPNGEELVAKWSYQMADQEIVFEAVGKYLPPIKGTDLYPFVERIFID